SAALPVAAGGELLVGAFDSSLLIGFTALFCCALAGGAAFGDPADFVSAGALFGVVPGLVAVWAGVLVFTVGAFAPPFMNTIAPPAPASTTTPAITITIGLFFAGAAAGTVAVA